MQDPNILLACPFCGAVPELSSDSGSHYEIECDCGMDRSSVIERLLSREEMQDDPHMEMSDWRTESRKTYSAEIKAKVGLEALRGKKTNREIGHAHGIHPVLVGQWKNVIQRRAKSLFEGKRGVKKRQ